VVDPGLGHEVDGAKPGAGPELAGHVLRGALGQGGQGPDASREVLGLAQPLARPPKPRGTAGEKGARRTSPEVVHQIEQEPLEALASRGCSARLG
jgi:hypothetical protein